MDYFVRKQANVIYGDHQIGGGVAVNVSKLRGCGEPIKGIEGAAKRAREMLTKIAMIQLRIPNRCRRIRFIPCSLFPRELKHTSP